MPLPSQSQQVWNSFYCVSLCQSLFHQRCVVSCIDNCKNLQQDSRHPLDFTSVCCWVLHIIQLVYRKYRKKSLGLTKAACHYFHRSATFKIGELFFTLTQNQNHLAVDFCQSKWQRVVAIASVSEPFDLNRNLFPSGVDCRENSGNTGHLRNTVAM